MQGQQGQLPDLRADTVAEANYALKADRAGRAPSKHSMLLSVLSSLFSRAHTIPAVLLRERVFSPERGCRVPEHRARELLPLSMQEPAAGCPLLPPASGCLMGVEAGGLSCACA